MAASVCLVVNLTKRKKCHTTPQLKKVTFLTSVLLLNIFGYKLEALLVS